MSNQMTPDYVIGIDPGMNNGYAVWNPNTKQLESVCSVPLFRLFDFINQLNKIYTLKVRIENPNTWVPFKGTKQDNSRLQGAGSVKQTYRHIIEFLEDQKIEYATVKLQGTMKKMKQDKFKQYTGWNKVTNEHGRDGAMLVYGI